MTSFVRGDRTTSGLDRKLNFVAQMRVLLDQEPLFRENPISTLIQSKRR